MGYCLFLGSTHGRAHAQLCELTFRRVKLTVTGAPSRRSKKVISSTPSVRDQAEHYSGVVGFLMLNFATGPGITGWIMWLALGIMVWFAMEKRKKAHFERWVHVNHIQ